MSLTQILLAIFTLINIIAFFIMANDKQKSIRGTTPDRTPEGLLFCVAAMGGSIGIYLCMLLLRHKTRKWYFQLGIPLLILQNLATLSVLRGLV